MKLYAQHGWGKSDRLERGLADELLQGIILSPHDEHPDDMSALIQSLAELTPRPDVMLDPQLYVSLLSEPNEGKLPLYNFYRSGLGFRDFTARNIQRISQDAINYQRGLPVSHILTPTVIQESFTDQSAQVAHALASESIEYWRGLSTDPRPILVSIVFSENALNDHDNVAEFLDTISLYDADGFYLVVDRNDPGYSQSFEPLMLTELMRAIRSLKQNRFQVICGYCDFAAMMCAVPGADAGATGWSQKLRRFNKSRFLPARGGRQPRERYSSSPLLNSIFVTELDACQEAGRIRAVKSNTPYDRAFDGRSYPSGVSWSPSENTLHHWATLQALYRRVNGSNVRERITQASRLIGAAQSLYSELARLGVTFDVPNGPGHLRQWANALDAFGQTLRS